jgi:hypothetical protein
MRKMILILLFFFACKDLPHPHNTSPEITTIIAADSSIASDTSVILECIAMDEDNDELQYTWISEEGHFEGVGRIVCWYPPQISGNFNIICEVQDPFGGMDRANIFIQVIKYDTVSIEHTDVFLWLDSRRFRKGNYYFTSDEEWKEFQIENGFAESEVIDSPIDFSKNTLIASFLPTTSGCSSYGQIMGSVMRYKGELLVYPAFRFDFGPCFAEIDPYHIISVSAIDVEVKFIGWVP